MVALPKQKIGPGIGASDIGAIMGVNPWKAPLDVYLELTGQREREPENAAMAWGKFVERRILEWYVEQTGATVHVPPESLYHPERAYLRATPDGIVLGEDGETWERLVEIKNANWRVADRFGEPGTDQVPDHYLVQIQQQLAVTGLERADLAAAIGGQPPAIYVIKRDDELISAILEDAADFWDRVQRGVPPEIDHTESYKKYLERRGVSDKAIKADDEIEELLVQIKEHREVMGEHAKAHDTLENRLRERLGTATVLESSLGKVTWRPSKPSAHPSKVAQGYREILLAAGVPEDSLDAVVQECTPEYGARPLRYPRGFPAKAK